MSFHSQETINGELIANLWEDEGDTDSELR